MFGGLRVKCCPIFCLMVEGKSAARFFVWWFKGEMLPIFLFDGSRGKCCRISCLMVWGGNAAQFSVWWFRGKCCLFLFDCKGAVLPNFVWWFTGETLHNFLFESSRGPCCPTYWFMVQGGSAAQSSVCWFKGEMLPNFLFDFQGEMLPNLLFDPLKVHFCMTI